MTHSSEVARRILDLLQERPLSFYALLKALDDVEYREILQGWGLLREKGLLDRDEEGRYLPRANAPSLE